MTQFGEKILTTIKTRTRGQGLGLVEDGLKKLDPLAASTVKKRARRRLHPQTTPNTSNLTMTGALLDSLTFRHVSRYRLKFSIRGVSQQKKGTYVQGKRPFFGLAQSEMRELTEFILNLIRRK